MPGKKFLNALLCFCGLFVFSMNAFAEPEEIQGRIATLEINPVVLPQCMVTCSYTDGIGYDDILTIPDCFSIEKDACEGEGSNLTPALELVAHLENGKKLVMLTTHSLSGPNLYNSSSIKANQKNKELNLPNLITSIAEIQATRGNIDSTFKTVYVKEIGHIIVGVKLKPLRNVAYNLIGQ